MSRGPLLEHDPRTVGEFTLQARLGSGASGTVYLAAASDGRLAAIKVFRVGTDPDSRRRWERELEAIRRIDTPRVAALIDADLTAQTPWVATDYVPGPTLAEHVRINGPLPIDLVDELAVGLATALADLHGVGIAHRDLTPNNIILSDHGPVLVDLGLAAIDGLSAMTRTGMQLGTPVCMSPEQAAGRSSGPPADVHAWAVNLLYAATGEYPFAADTAEAAMAKILRDRPSVGTLPPTWQPAARAALTKRPDDRPPADALLAGSRFLLTRGRARLQQGRRILVPIAGALAIIVVSVGLGRFSTTEAPTLRKTSTGGNEQMAAPSPDAVDPSQAIGQGEAPVATPPSPRLPTAPWSGPAVPPDTEDMAEAAQWWADAFGSDPDCPLFWPHGIEEATGARTLWAPTMGTHIHVVDIIWEDEAGETVLSLSVWDAEDPNAFDVYDAASPAPAWSDGSLLGVMGEEAFAPRLLAIAGTDCFYEVHADTMLFLGWGIQGLRQVELPAASR